MLLLAASPWIEFPFYPIETSTSNGRNSPSSPRGFALWSAWHFSVNEVDLRRLRLNDVWYQWPPAIHSKSKFWFHLKKGNEMRKTWFDESCTMYWREAEEGRLSCVVRCRWCDGGEYVSGDSGEISIPKTESCETLKLAPSEPTLTGVRLLLLLDVLALSNETAKTKNK